MSLDPCFSFINGINCNYFREIFNNFLLKLILNYWSIPVFVSALIVAYLIKYIFKKFKLEEYVDRFTVQRISGTATDLWLFQQLHLKLNVANNFTITDYIYISNIFRISYGFYM